MRMSLDRRRSSIAASRSTLRQRPAVLRPMAGSRRPRWRSRAAPRACCIRSAFARVSELPLPSGRRADIVALGGDGEIWIVEIKSSVADFRADQKWMDYRLHCDRLFFATTLEVPCEIFPKDTGLIVADAFGASIVCEAPEHRLPAATRRSMMLRFAHAAALRLQALADPSGPYGDGILRRTAPPSMSAARMAAIREGACTSPRRSHSLLAPAKSRGRRP